MESLKKYLTLLNLKKGKIVRSTSAGRRIIFKEQLLTKNLVISNIFDLFFFQIKF